MDSKDLIIGGLVIGIIYLLTKKENASGSDVIFNPNAELTQGIDGERTVCVHSSEPLKATYIKGSKKGNAVMVNIQAKAYDDHIKNFDTITGLTMKRGGAIPFIF